MGDRPMRICLMVTGLNRAGAETQVVRLAIGLRDRGHVVSLLSLIPPDAFVDLLQANGIEVVSLNVTPGRIDPRLLTRSISHLRRFRPAVLVSFMFHANLLARFAGSLSGVPCILNSVRGERFGESGSIWKLLSVKIRKWIMRLTARMATGVTTNSVHLAQKLIADHLAHAERLEVIPNIVESLADRGEPGDQSWPDIQKDQFLWLNVARLSPVKDHSTLLRAFALHAERHDPSPLLVIAGGGEAEVSLKTLTDQLAITESVHFLGECEEVASLYRSADAVILSSTSEGLPNVLLEAHAAGLPIVATDVGGCSEIVLGGTSGYLVPPGSPAQLAEAMDRMVSLQPAERRRMGAEGKRHVLSRFERESVLDRWEMLFRRCLIDLRRR